MEKLKKKIVSFFKKENISVLYFKDACTEDFLIEQPAELAITINRDDIPKWDYFSERVNCCGRAVSRIYKDNTLRFIFEGAANGPEKELLERNLETFYNCLQKRYFTVCPLMKTFSILIKPTHRCNLDCKYCYDKPYRETIKTDMSMEVLDRTVKLLSEYTESVAFIWHGGEPTLVGIDWYKRAYEEVFSKYPMLHFNFSMMSNGVNLNEEWFELFKKYKIDAGASYNAHYQAKLRCSSQTGKTAERDEKLSRNIDKMLRDAKKQGTKIGVIDVITGVNYKNIIEIYEFYKKRGISVCLNHIFHTKQTEENGLEISAEEYANEFLKYFRHWLFDKNGIHERAAEEMLSVVIGGTKNLTCRFDDCRYKWLGINPLGEIYPCDRYYPEKYKVGTVFDFNSIKDVFENEAYQLYCREVQKRFDTKCKECGYWFACKGACNGNSIEVYGNCEGVEEFVCELFRRKYTGIYEILRDLNWIDNKEINPYARRLMIDKGFYSVREIKEFLREIGKKFELEYDRDNLLQCSEYQIFRGINYMENDFKVGRHVNFINSFKEKDIRANRESRKQELINYLNEVAAAAVMQNK